MFSIIEGELTGTSPVLLSPFGNPVVASFPIVKIVKERMKYKFNDFSYWHSERRLVVGIVLRGPSSTRILIFNNNATFLKKRSIVNDEGGRIIITIITAGNTLLLL